MLILPKVSIVLKDTALLVVICHNNLGLQDTKNNRLSLWLKDKVSDGVKIWIPKLCKPNIHSKYL